MENIEKKLTELEEKIDKVYKSAETTRKYFFWSIIATIVIIVVPLVAIIFVMPSFLSNYIGSLQGLGL